MSQPAASEPIRPPARVFPRGLAAILLSLLLLVPPLILSPVVAQTLNRAILAIDLPTLQMDNEEGALLFQSLELRAGRSIYRPLTTYPYFVGTYPPLYMAAGALLADPAAPTFLGGRVLTLAAALGIGLLLALITGVRTRNPAAAVLASVLFLATFEVYSWVAYYRVDLPAVFLTLAGLACVICAPGSRAARAASIALFVLALYTKQTTVPAPLAVMVALLARDRRSGLRYATCFVAAAVVPFLLLTLLTRGQFAVHTVFYNMNTYQPRELLRWARHLRFLYSWLMIALLAATGGIAWLAWGSGSGRWISRLRAWLSDPLWIYVPLALLSTLTIAKAGTAENYLIEPLAALALAIGDSSGRLIRSVREGRWSAAVPAAGIAALLILHAMRLSSPFILGAVFSKRPVSADLAAAAEVQRRVREKPGEVFAELSVFTIRSRKDIVFQPFIMSELARQGRWDPAPLVEDLRRGRFSLLVTNRDIAAGPDEIYAPALIDAMNAGYRETGRIPGRLWNYYFYQPRGM